MQFSNNEEDDFNLSTAARSRLSSLFQAETAGGDVNQALTFTAPKQPKKNDNAQSSSGALKLIHASVVHAYKLKDGNYINQGKLGCAILGLHETSSYKFLLYKGKQIQVTSCSIVPSFNLHVQPNNYVNFYDDKKDNWSVNFDSEASLIEFAKQIALAKANSQGKTPSSLVVQDLVNGEGPPLENGISAEVKYTGWLLSNYTFGQVFDSNMDSESTYRVRLGKSKVIKGWHEGLVGALKGCRRLLIIPPTLAYGSEGMGSSVPPNSSLIFEIHIVKLKIPRESSHSPSPLKASDNVADKKPEVPPRHSFSQEDNIRMRGASISEQLTQSPKKDNAQLISRMAKMGTATLPLQGAIPAQVSSESDNEEDVHQESPVTVPGCGSRTSSPKAFSKPRSRTNSGVTSSVPLVHPQVTTANVPFHVTQHSSQVSLYAQAGMPAPQPYVPPSVTYAPYQSPIPGQYQIPQSQYPMHSIPGLVPPISTSVADAHLPLLITETRSQNSEVRLSLSKITDKVDSILQKVEDLRLQQGRPAGVSHITFMEGAVLIQNIERIVQENIQLKDDVEAKNSKIQTLNEKICDLLQRNQRFFEESSSMLEQRSDSLQVATAQSHARYLNLEQEKQKLCSELSDATAKLKALEADLMKGRSQENELQEKVLESERRERLLKDMKEQTAENERVLNAVQEELKNVKHENRLLTTNLQNLEENYNELEQIKNTLEKLLVESKQEMQDIASKAISEQLQEGREAQKNHVGLKMDDPSESLRKELADVRREKDELESRAQDLQKKLITFEKSELLCKEKLSKLQTEVENSLMWKKKYDIFHEKTRTMKERYENRVVELMTEVKNLQSAKIISSSPDFSSEIKKVMNVLYKLLQGKFDPNTSYLGSEVLKMTLQTIRGLTMQMLEMKQAGCANSLEQEVEAEKQPSEEHKTDMPENISENSSRLKIESNETETLVEQNGVGEKNEVNAGKCTVQNSTLCTDSVSKLSPSIENAVSNELQNTENVLNEGSAETEDNLDVLKANGKVSEDISRVSPDRSGHLPSSNSFADKLSAPQRTEVVRGSFEVHA